MHALGTALIVCGFLYLLAVAAWTGGLLPFTRRDARRRGESYDRTRASMIPRLPLLGSIIAVMVGFWIRAYF